MIEIIIRLIKKSLFILPTSLTNLIIFVPLTPPTPPPSNLLRNANFYYCKLPAKPNRYKNCRLSTRTKRTSWRIWGNCWCTWTTKMTARWKKSTWKSRKCKHKSKATRLPSVPPMKETLMSVEFIGKVAVFDIFTPYTPYNQFILILSSYSLLYYTILA